MQTIVITFNVTLACCCLIVARWVWQLRLSLRRSTQILILTEMIAHDALHDAPAQIAQGQFSLRQWNQVLAQIGPAIGRGKALLTWAQRSQTLLTLLGGRPRLGWRWRRHR